MDEDDDDNDDDNNNDEEKKKMGERIVSVVVFLECVMMRQRRRRCIRISVIFIMPITGISIGTRDASARGSSGMIRKDSLYHGTFIMILPFGNLLSLCSGLATSDR